jgi:hypothetical protein
MRFNGADCPRNYEERRLMISKWIGRYDYNAPDNIGKIVNIDGVGDKDTYNPSLCQHDGKTILAFRCEDRASDIYNPNNYHPQILFAQNNGLNWELTNKIAVFDMLEDPLFCEYSVDDESGIIFGGVGAKLVSEGQFEVRTSLYKGMSLDTLDRTPFAIIEGMKDERLFQLPDKRFLLCKRPLDDNGMGRVVAHILNNLDELKSINTVTPPVAFELQGPYVSDWIGINNIYLLIDKDGTNWIGLLGHVANHDGLNGKRHYAATTYKFKLIDLINGNLGDIVPTVIATRSCFENGPAKNDGLADVVFPGSLEHIDGDRYNLWAGLSDTKIGVLEIDDPFKLNQ